MEAFVLTLDFLIAVLVILCVLTQSCLTLCNPMDCSPPDTSVHGIFQERILEWAAISFCNTVIPFLAKAVRIFPVRRGLANVKYPGKRQR